jgi:hypothetical protein
MENKTNLPPGVPQRNRRISKAAQRLIKRNLIAGASTSQINILLKRLGEPPLAPSSVTHYRKDPRVRKAREEAEAETLQSGIALRTNQINALKRTTVQTLLRMYGFVPLPEESYEDHGILMLLTSATGSAGDGTLRVVQTAKDGKPVQNYVETKDWIRLNRLFHEELRLIIAIVDKSPALAAHIAEQAAQGKSEYQASQQAMKREILSGCVMGMLNDALKEILAEDSALSNTAGVGLACDPRDRSDGLSL